MVINLFCVRYIHICLLVPRLTSLSQKVNSTIGQTFFMKIYFAFKIKYFQYTHKSPKHRLSKVVDSIQLFRKDISQQVPQFFTIVEIVIFTMFKYTNYMFQYSN